MSYTLALIGGEEFADGFEDVHARLAEVAYAHRHSSNGHPLKIAFLPTCAAHDGIETVEYWCDMAHQRLGASGAEISALKVIDQASADDPENARRNLGVGKDGQPHDGFQLGMELLGKYTVLAEGARGHLGKQLIEKFKLDDGRDPQSYALDIKELWEVPAAQAKPGAFGFADDPAASKTTKKPGDTSESTALVDSATQAGVVAVDYAEYGRRAMQVLDARPGTLKGTYFPHVSMGWDGSPRNYSMGLVLNNTPEKWGEFLRQTRIWLDRHPESRGIVTLNSWNERVEGSYLEPDTLNGMKYLEAVKGVFPVVSVGPPAVSTDTASHAVLPVGTKPGEKATMNHPKSIIR